MTTDDDEPGSADFLPATLQTLENGMTSIWFSCDEFDARLDVVAAFEAAGLSGGGYDWEAVLAPALAKKDPQAFAAVEWSPESDTLVAISREREPLRVLAAVLREVVADQESLVKAVAAHDPDRT
jgi:hypothetical protein